MNIIYASNDGYARHLGVSLLSLLDHNRDADEIVIYLLSVGMSEQNQINLQQVAEEFGRELVVIEMGDLKKRFITSINTRGFDISTMTRLFASEVLPEKVVKAIYLDCDTVIIGSLSRLWEIPLGNHLLGMTLEPTAYEKMRAVIGLSMDDAYYNAGVLLMNLENWRQERITERLLQYYAEQGGNLFACDQDVINGALKGRIKTLPPQYNFPTNYWYFGYPTLLKLSASYRQITPDQFKAAKRRPVVIHYMGDERPWIAGNKNRFSKYYDYYLSRTPWRGIGREKGKELYMMVYHWMNIATLLCPPIRLFISRHFGMQVIDGRKSKGALLSSSCAQPGEGSLTGVKSKEGLPVVKVSCVILNYNDARTTTRLVRAIRDFPCLHQIVVVDNASTDHSLAQLRLLETDSKVCVLEADRNGGYGAGNNLGVRYSVEVCGAEYVLIANPDITVTEACIRRLTAVVEKIPDLGVAAAAMIDPEFKDKPNAWRLHGFWGELLSMGPLSRRLFRQYLEYPKRYLQKRACVPVDVVHGSLLMVKGKAFLDCGGYDENIFLYQEEAVLGFRMRTRGYRTALLTNVFYYHQHSASISNTYHSQAARQRLRHDSTVYYLKEYLKISKGQERIARVWFAGIMAEISGVQLLTWILKLKK